MDAQSIYERYGRMKYKSLEHFARDVMEKKNISDFERQLYDAQKHMSGAGVSLNPNYAKLEKDQTAADTPAIDKETDRSVTDTPERVAKAATMTDTPKDELDGSITDTSQNDERKSFQNLERAQRVLKIRNMRAQNKIKIIDNA